MNRWIAALFVALLLGAFLAGCGGSSSTSTSTVTVQQTAALSKPQFIAKGDAICQSAREESQQLQDEGDELLAAITPENERSQLQEIGGVAAESAEVVRGQVENLRSLKAPDGDRETINRMLALVDSQALIEEELAAASEAVDIEKIEALLEQGKPLKAKAQGIAQGYGFEVCGTTNR